MIEIELIIQKFYVLISFLSLILISLNDLSPDTVLFYLGLF